jgi:hypothetical protein
MVGLLILFNLNPMLIRLVVAPIRVNGPPDAIALV